jgi:hypothetical protein
MKSESVALWQLVLVTVGSGLASGLLVGVLQMHSERRERMRDRRIIAADELVTAVIKGLTPIRAILAEKQPMDWDAMRPDCDAVTVGYDEAVAYVARVDLLFGQNSPTGKAVAAMMDAFAAAKKEVERKPSDLTEARKLRDTAADRLDDYTRAAHAAVVRSRWRRPGSTK